MKKEYQRIKSQEGSIEKSTEKNHKFQSRHFRMKSMNVASPSLQILFNTKQAWMKPSRFYEKDERKSLSSLRDLESNLICKKMRKLSKEVLKSFSVPKSKWGSESRFSYDINDRSSKQLFTKSSKNNSKESKKFTSSDFSQKKMASKLNKHIENTLWSKSVYEKNISSLKKIKSKHHNLPLPSIFQNKQK